jgi:hypothetical protein
LLLGLAGLLIVALAGPSGGRPNLASVVVLVLLWGAIVVGSALVGPWWPLVSPFVLMARLIPPRRGDAATGAGGGVVPAARGPAAAVAGAWAGPVLLAGLLWLQRAYHVPGSPRALALLLVIYTGAVLICIRRWGPGWATRHEPLAALSTLLGAIAPVGPAPDGRWRRRWVRVGTTAVSMGPADAAVLLLALGAILFRALSYTPLWIAATEGLTGWARSGVSTLGLIWLTGALAGVLVGAVRLGARLAGRRSPVTAGGVALVCAPLLVGATLAVEGAVWVFSARLALVLASDPLGLGWDLLGTSGDTVSLAVLAAPGAIYLELGVLLLAGVAALLFADALAVGATTSAAPPPPHGRDGTATLPVAVALVTVVAVLLLLGG